MKKCIKIFLRIDECSYFDNEKCIIFSEINDWKENYPIGYGPNECEDLGEIFKKILDCYPVINNHFLLRHVKDKKLHDLEYLKEILKQHNVEVVSSKDFIGLKKDKSIPEKIYFFNDEETFYTISERVFDKYVKDSSTDYTWAENWLENTIEINLEKIPFDIDRYIKESSLILIESKEYKTYSN